LAKKVIKFIVKNIYKRWEDVATSDYYGYKVIAKTGAYVGTIFVYALSGIKLEAIYRGRRL